MKLHRYSFSRRMFLGGMAGIPLLGLHSVSAATADDNSDIMICIFQRGAADGLNMVVPHGDDNYYINRPGLAIARPGSGSNTAIDLDGFFGLHPSLASLEPLFKEGELALVQAVGSPHDTHSHFEAQDYMERGTPGSSSLSSGWLNRYLDTSFPDPETAFGGVSIGALLPTSLRGDFPSSAISSLDNFNLQGNEQITADMKALLGSFYSTNELLHQSARETFTALAQMETANPSQYAAENGAEYPESELGEALFQVGQMIKADIGLKVACVDSGGWDTHQGQGSTEGLFAGLVDDLGKAIAAFHQDMGSRMAGITLVTMTEFGRRVAENGSNGTDHGHGSCMIVAGQGVNGGNVYGNWPGLAASQLYGPGDLDVTTDFRKVFSEALQKRTLSSQLGTIFPGFSLGSPLGIFKEK